jgi:hypothetical protein
MTRPALRPLTVATAVAVAGAAGAVPATAAGAPLGPQAVERPGASHLLSIPPAALPAEVGAAVTRGHGAPQTGLAASSVTVAGDGRARWERGTDPSARRPRVDAVRARGPPS